MPIEPSPPITLPDAVSATVLRLSDRILGVLAGLAVPAAVAIMLLDREWYPVASGLGAAAFAGGWGLLRHHEPAKALRAVWGLEWLLVALAIAAALIAGFGGFFWMMGPAPIL